MSTRGVIVDSAEFLHQGPLRSLYGVVQPLFDRITGLHRTNGVGRQLQHPEMKQQLFCEEGLRLPGATLLPRRMMS